MAASALAFERNRIGVNQILAVRPQDGGASRMPLRARDLEGLRGRLNAYGCRRAGTRSSSLRVPALRISGRAVSGSLATPS